MSSKLKIAVSSKSFAKNDILVEELKSTFPDADIALTPLSSDVMPRQDLVDLCSGASYLIVGREIIDSASLKELSHLKGISKYGVGVDNIDFEAARETGLEVIYEKGVNSWEVTELAVCLMVSCARKVAEGDRKLHQGIWGKDGGTNLAGKTVGIIGCGHIGSKVAKVLLALDCKILINDIEDKSEFIQSLGENASSASKEDIYASCDFITLHTPLTELTRYLLNESTMELLKPGAILVNTARGALIEEKALIGALKSGRLRAAGLDVYEQEPLQNRELYTLENFVGTAHIGGSSKEASLKMGRAAINGLKRLILDKIDQE